MPINSISQCELNQGLHELIIPIESQEDSWHVHWPMNTEEESRNENVDDNELVSKEPDLNKIMPHKNFDEIDTKPRIVTIEKQNKSTIHELAIQLGNRFEMMLQNLTEIYLHDTKRLQQGVTTFLGATGSMRMLQIEDKFKESLRSQLIFMHIRNEFQRRLSIMSKHWPTITNYFHTRIGTLTGKEEAIAYWVACSYLLRRFYADSTSVIKPGLYEDFSFNLFDKGFSFGSTIETALVHETAIDLVRKTGIVHLDEISMRITFPIHGTNKYMNSSLSRYNESIDELRIMNVKYQVYGASLMCFGLDRMFVRSIFNLIKQNPQKQALLHPCLNSDVQFNRTIEDLTSQLCLRRNANSTYSSKNFNFETYQLNGDFDQEKCYELVHNLIDYDECSKNFMFCASPEMLSPPNNLTFIGTSKLYDLTRIFGRNIINVPYSRYEQGTRNWCTNELRYVLGRELRKIVIYKDAVRYCFALHYVESMFVNIFQIAKEDFEHISFINRLDKEEIEWSLGYLIGNLELKAKSSLSTVFHKLNNIFILLLTFSPIFIFFSFKEEIKHLVDAIKYKYFIR